MDYSGDEPWEKTRRIAELEDWKRSAEKVFEDLNLQEIGNELELPLGSNIAKAILPWIRMAKSHAGSWALTKDYFDKVYGK